MLRLILWVAIAVWVAGVGMGRVVPVASDAYHWARTHDNLTNAAILVILAVALHLYPAQWIVRRWLSPLAAIKARVGVPQQMATLAGSASGAPEATRRKVQRASARSPAAGSDSSAPHPADGMPRPETYGGHLLSAIMEIRD